MKLYSISAIFLFSVFGISCTSNNNSGSDNRVSDERSIDEVNRVRVEGVINLILSQSDNPTLRIEGDEAMVSKLIISQTGDLLELNFDEDAKDLFENSTLDVYLSVGDLTEFEFDGVGNIKTESPLKLNELILKGSGVGNIFLQVEAKKIESEFDLLGNLKLEGSVEEISLSNEGIGNVDASGLQSKKMNLNSSGIGKVDVFCDGELTLEVNGIGSVSYTGNPTVVSENISGIGKVHRN